jgi:signal transduction histidine kinase
MSVRLSDRALQRWSWASFAFYVLSFVVSAVVQLLDPTMVTDWGSQSTFGDLAFIAMTALFPVVGILIIHRQPRNTVGWLLHATGVAWALSAWVDAYVRLSLHVVHWVPGGITVEVVGSMLWWPPIVVMGVYTILFFPDGRLPSRRWLFLPWLAGIDCLLGMLVFVVVPGRVPDVVEPLASNPLALPLSPGLVTALTILLFPVLPFSLLAAAASLFVRFHRSTGVQRLQLKWLMSAVVFIASTYALSVAVSFSVNGDNGPWWVAVLQTVSIMAFGLIPITIGIAITRHGLYGIDSLISRALVVGSLGVFITGVYVGIVVGVGALIGQRQPSVWLSVLATALVAIAFQPAREAVRRAVNRLVYGARATPYEVLSDFASRMTGRYTTAELLPQISRTVSECLGGAQVELWLRNAQQLVRAAAYPAPSARPADATVTLSGPDDLSPLSADRVVPVRHRGEVLGAITVTRAAAEPITPTEDEMLEHVASQTGLVLRNLRLVDDLHSSRQRLVTSQDQQRRRLERNLHDGAQQSLVAVALMLRMAANQTDPDVLAASINQAADQLQVAIGELRELARGIHPAILTDRGLVPAVSSLAERCPVPVRLDNELTRRLPDPVEGALYFVVAECLTNVAKYAHAHLVTVTLRDLGRRVSLEVVDDGVGGADTATGSGLMGLADRVSVVDGTFTLHSPPGHGTRVGCEVPVPAPVPHRAPATPRVTEPAL